MRRSTVFLAFTFLGALSTGGAWAQLPSLPLLPMLPVPIPTPPSGGPGTESACCQTVPCTADTNGDCTNVNGGMACNAIEVIALDPANPPSGLPTPPSPPDPAHVGGCVELLDIEGITDILNDAICVGGGVNQTSNSGAGCVCIGPLCGAAVALPPAGPNDFVPNDPGVCTASAVAGCVAAGTAHCTNTGHHCGPAS